jgi:hypothetical protein
VQGVAVLSRAVGYRFGQRLPEAVPLVITYAKKAAEGDDELREYVLQVMDTVA